MSSSTQAPDLSDQFSLKFDCHIPSCWGIDIHPTSHNLFVADPLYCQFHEIDGQSGVILHSRGEIKERHCSAGGGLAITSDNQILISQHFCDQIAVFSAATGQKSADTKPIKIEHPLEIAIDRTRNVLFVCTSEEMREIFEVRVVSLKSGGGENEIISSCGNDRLRPIGVAVNESMGLVYVTTERNPGVHVFESPEGSQDPIQIFGEDFVNQGNEFLAFDAQNDQVIVGNESGKFFLFSWDGEIVGAFDLTKICGFAGVEEMRSIKVGKEGQIYVCCKADGKHRVICVVQNE